MKLEVLTFFHPQSEVPFAKKPFSDRIRDFQAFSCVFSQARSRFGI